MAITGALNLSYSAYYGISLRNLCFDNESRTCINDIIYEFLTQLNEFLTNSDTSIESIKSLTKKILFNNEFNCLTISSIAHCIHMIQSCTYPFDKKIYGFDLREILGMFRIYVSEQSKWVAEFEKNNGGSSFAADQMLIAKALNKKPEIKKQFEELRRKLTVKYGDGTGKIKDERENKYAKNDDPNNS